MIPAPRILDEFRTAGFGLVTGVPCSYLTPLIDTVIADPDTDYVGATNEGDALALAAGSELAGRRSVVMFQNSGLGNAINPLTSLTWSFRIPALILTTWRGQPGGAPDEPQHEVMGEITGGLLDLARVPWEPFPTEEAELAAALGRARAHMDLNKTPYGLIMEKGTVEPGAGRTESPLRPLPPPGGEAAPDPWPALEADAVLREAFEATEADAVITTTGFTGRALYAVGDRENQLYMVGSMGCASSLALGLALTRPDLRVVCLDGDGALLMRMGALATLGYERPKNLVHVLLDNGVHDSTGAQATVSRSVDPVGVARACGYPRVERLVGAGSLHAALAAPTDELTFLHVRTEPRADRKLSRPTITPPEVAERLRGWIAAR